MNSFICIIQTIFGIFIFISIHNKGGKIRVVNKTIWIGVVGCMIDEKNTDAAAVMLKFLTFIREYHTPRHTTQNIGCKQRNRRKNLYSSYILIFCVPVQHFLLRTHATYLFSF